MTKKQKYKKSDMARIAKKKEYINNIKNAGCCELCKEDYTRALQFHHKDASDKKINISNMAKYDYSIATIQAEIDKCMLVCANCHTKLHYGVDVEINEYYKNL